MAGYDGHGRLSDYASCKLNARSTPVVRRRKSIQKLRRSCNSKSLHTKSNIFHFQLCSWGPNDLFAAETASELKAEA
jgi:hypothetical protein